MEELRKHIGEIYDGSFFKPTTCLYNRDGEAWQLQQFEETVDFGGKRYFVVLVEKVNFDPEDIDCVEDVEDVFFKAVEL